MVLCTLHPSPLPFYPPLRPSLPVFPRLGTLHQWEGKRKRKPTPVPPPLLRCYSDGLEE